MPAIVALVLLASSAPAAAQSPRGRVDVGGAVMVEMWDLNESRETLAGVTGGVEHRVWRAVSLRADVMALHVRQWGDDAWLRGFTFGSRFRWGPRRAAGFADVAVGLSHGTRRVPPEGTRLNYLAAIGGGVHLPLSGRGGLDLGMRWLHVSNNGRQGRARNPDIQSLGVAAAIGWSWGTRP